MAGRFVIRRFFQPRSVAGYRDNGRSRHFNLLWQEMNLRGKGIDVMKFGMRTPQALAATEEDSLVHAEAPSTAKSELDADIEPVVQGEVLSTSNPETDAEIEPLIQTIGATSIAEIEKLMGKLQDAKHFLQSEGERIQRETTRYTNLAQTASASVKIILDTVQEWRRAGHPVHNQSGSAFEMRALAEDNTATSVQDEQQPQASGQVSAL
jgi:hypothetical protein